MHTRWLLFLFNMSPIIMVVATCGGMRIKNILCTVPATTRAWFYPQNS
jgi:hypothetical protein